MTVIAMNFTGVHATRSDKPIKGELKVNSTPKITEVKEISVSRLNQKALSMNFEFLTDYSQDVGQIKVEGNLLVLAPEPAKVAEQWKKGKTLPEEVSVDVLNHLFRRCLVKIAMLADDLQLPPPIQLPRVQPKKE